MHDITVQVHRYDPDKKTEHVEQFTVSVTDKSTVLEVLMQIYDHHDSTLALTHGCRVKNCGLCAVTVNGHPRYACVTRIKPNTTIAPLQHLPLIRDLVIDRAPFFHYLSRFNPYLIREKLPETEPEMLHQLPEHATLMSCRECFACLATCRQYDFRDDTFGGPLGFVKLAQLHYDTRDCINRAAQARGMGISRCTGCSGCTCIAGIPLKKLVIEPFLLNMQIDADERG